MTNLQKAVLLILVIITISTVAEPISDKTRPTIVALAPHIVENLFHIGAGQQILAVSAHSDYPEQANSLPVVSGYNSVDIERIVALQPDLIIAWKPGISEQSANKLKELGLSVHTTDPQTLEEIADELEWLGHLSGWEERSKTIAADYRNQLEQLRSKFQQQVNLKVFYEVWHSPLTTIGPDAWPSQHLKICGAKSGFEDTAADYPQVNIEQVLQQNIDAIIQPISLQSPSATQYNWNKWLTSLGVSEASILRPNADLLHRMSFRSLDAIEELCDGLMSIRAKRYPGAEASAVE